MDDRVDTLARLVASKRTRRGLAHSLVGLAVSGGLIPTLAEPAIAGKRKHKHGKRKKPCGPCRHKQRGRCRPRPDATPCGECGACLDGVCTPAKVDCGGACMECDATARCRAKPDGAVCLGNGTCLNGLCNKPV
jgi:hypothetical protein